jgi:3-oxoacyl-[acyl-carrier-protein] synthase II
MIEPSPVWITGIGVGTPLGNSPAALADQVLAGRSAVRRIEGFNVSEYPSQVAAQFGAVPCPAGWDPAEFAGYDVLQQVTCWCGTEALRDAGWTDRPARIGLVLGLGIEWGWSWELHARQTGNAACAPEDDRPARAAWTCRKLGLSGPAVSLSAACASGNYALMVARSWLRAGLVDACLAGACDMSVTPMSLASFGNLRALSRRNADPSAASRPFDKDRDGFVIGEGGAVFFLEPARTARQRGARAYAEIAGCGARSDAHHMLIPSPDPGPAIAAMREALADAAISPADIDYINAHATGTAVGDIGEAAVLQAVLGNAVARVPVSSTKSMTGHVLTAAAAVEAVICIMAMQRSAVPPTINLDHPDPACSLCHVANEARPQPVRVAVSNSFGFGGSNTCLVLRAV